MAERTLKVVIAGDARGATRALGQVEDRAGRMSRTVEATFRAVRVAALGVAAGVAAAAVGFVGAAKRSVAMNAELETATLQFETLMGDADEARQHVENLFDFAAKTPFETGPIIEASRMLQTFGGEALNSSENLLLVGDAAAAVSAGMDEVAFWVGRAFSAVQAGKPFGEAAARLQELAILSPQARSEMEELQAAGADASEVWGVLERDLARFGGAMEKQAGTWAGLRSTIVDNISMINATALRPLFEALKAVGQAAAEWLQSDDAQRWAESVAEFVAGAIDAISEFAGWLSGEFRAHLESGMSPLQALLATVQSVGDRLLQMLPPEFVRQTQGLGTALMIMAAPMGLIVRDLLPALRPVIEAVIPPLAQMANDVAPALATTLSALAQTVVPLLVTWLTGLATILSAHPEIVEALIAAWAAFKGGAMVISAFKAIQSGFVALTTALSANPWLLLIAATVALVVLVIRNWDTIIGAIRQAFNWIKATLSGVATWIREKWEGLWSGVREILANVVGWIEDRWEGLLAFFRGLPGRIGSALRLAGDFLSAPFRAQFNAIARLWNSTVARLRFTVPDWVPGIGGKGFSVPKIPTLHSGGVVPGLPGEEVLVLLEAGEEIISRRDRQAGRQVVQHIVMPQADPDRVMAAAAWRLRTAGI